MIVSLFIGTGWIFLGILNFIFFVKILKKRGPNGEVVNRSQWSMLILCGEYLEILL